jgi:hypothetical protein
MYVCTRQHAVISSKSMMLIITLHDPDDGSRMFLPNAATYLQYTAVCSSETLLCIYLTTRRHTPPKRLQIKRLCAKFTDSKMNTSAKLSVFLHSERNTQDGARLAKLSFMLQQRNRRELCGHPVLAGSMFTARRFPPTHRSHGPTRFVRPLKYKSLPHGTSVPVYSCSCHSLSNPP